MVDKMIRDSLKETTVPLIKREIEMGNIGFSFINSKWVEKRPPIAKRIYN